MIIVFIIGWIVFWVSGYLIVTWFQNKKFRKDIEMIDRLFEEERIASDKRMKEWYEYRFRSHS